MNAPYSVSAGVFLMSNFLVFLTLTLRLFSKLLAITLVAASIFSSFMSSPSQAGQWTGPVGFNPANAVVVQGDEAGAGSAAALGAWAKIWLPFGTPNVHSIRQSL